MLPENTDSVIASYHRCLQGEGFIDTFYDLFLAKSPEVQQKFRHTDFAHQKLMLRESLLVLILFSQDQAENRMELEQLAKFHDHDHSDIPPAMYDMWLNALCAAIQKHDPMFASDVEQRWRAAMQPGIDLMISLY